MSTHHLIQLYSTRSSSVSKMIKKTVKALRKDRRGREARLALRTWRLRRSTSCSSLRTTISATMTSRFRISKIIPRDLLRHRNTAIALESECPRWERRRTSTRSTTSLTPTPRLNSTYCRTNSRSSSTLTSNKWQMLQAITTTKSPARLLRHISPDSPKATSLISTTLSW